MSAAKKLNTLNPQIKPHWNNRILVVDDEVSVADSYKDILISHSNNVVPMKSRSSRSRASNTEQSSIQTPYDFDLTIVYNAEDAIKAVKKSIADGEPFAMGFFDVKLGLGMDGVELVHEIYNICPDLFAVFVTAHNDRTIESIQKVLGKKQDCEWDYLSKPFTRGEIIQKARNFCSLWNLNTERKEHEQQLQTMHEKLLGSERMSSVSAVARGVGHEFGNILMQIMGKAELSLDKDFDGMKQGLEKVIDASQRAMEILDRFKDLSQTDAMETMKEKIIIEELLTGTVDLMEHQINMSNCTLNFTAGTSHAVFANSTALMQVFVNLIINGIHAMGDNGQIDIEIEETSDKVIVSFHDYGPGIPEELLYKVTEPLFTTKEDMGTGLGLAICKEIIEIEHGGRFELVNHPSGKGLVVSLTLPKFEGGSHE